MKSDCFVMPSYREGFPNTVMEAGAMGLPSVVTDINGSREIIIHGENGLIVPSKDANALYVAMKQILLDKAAREKMATNARPFIESRFEKSFVQGCLIKYYEEILN
jgi:glycosyltransferase involved in cell wall biosynthesis